jgi:hypothetical protein
MSILTLFLWLVGAAIVLIQFAAVVLSAIYLERIWKILVRVEARPKSD